MKPQAAWPYRALGPTRRSKNALVLLLGTGATGDGLHARGLLHAAPAQRAGKSQFEVRACDDLSAFAAARGAKLT